MKLGTLISKLEKVRSEVGDNTDVIIRGSYGSYTDFIKKITAERLSQDDPYDYCVIYTDLMSG